MGLIAGSIICYSLVSVVGLWVRVCGLTVWDSDCVFAWLSCLVGCVLLRWYLVVYGLVVLRFALCVNSVDVGCYEFWWFRLF